MAYELSALRAAVVTLLLLPVGGAVALGLVGRRLPRAWPGWIATATVAGALVVACRILATLLAHPEAPAQAVGLAGWVDFAGLHLAAAALVDPLSAVMLVLVLGVGLLVHIFSLGYMAHDPSVARYFAALNFFVAAMLILVLADSLPGLFVGWEGVGLASYLLIGFWWSDEAKARAGKTAFVVNRVGDVGLLAAMMVLWRATGSLEVGAIKQAVAHGDPAIAAWAAAAAMLMVAAVCGKSAQIPLYVWLPHAMAGPTPVSALIHAATMVTAGIYLMSRWSFLFALAPAAMLTIAWLGALTALWAALVAIAQHDIKRVLAYSTVSQLGLMCMAAGVGAWSAAMMHVLAHACFKGCLFLAAGSIIHALGGEQDIRRMGGLARRLPWTAAALVAAALAISGAPLTAGFISKDALLFNAFVAELGPFHAAAAGCGKALWLLGTLASGLTAFYMWRLVFLVLFCPAAEGDGQVRQHPHEAPWSMRLPQLLLAALSLGAGALNWPHALGGSAWLDRWLAPSLPAPAEVLLEHHALELGLMAFATAVAAVGFLLAYGLFARGIHPWCHRLAHEPPWSALHRALGHGGYVDELVSTCLSRPFAGLCRTVLAGGLERFGVLAAAEWVAWTVRSAGFAGQLLHVGGVQRYVAIFAASCAVLLYGWLSFF